MRIYGKHLFYLFNRKGRILYDIIEKYYKHYINYTKKGEENRDCILIHLLMVSLPLQKKLL